MEHASRGRRSGNKGVGARWRGRFRIFSARHCSRTKVSHAENSGMTMLFFSWRLLQCRRGILSRPQERRHEEVLVFFGDCSGVGVCVDHGSGHTAPCRLRRGRHEEVLVFFGDCSGVGGGIVSHPRSLGTTQRGRGAVAVCFEGCCGSMCWPGDRPATHAAAGAAARGVRGILGDSFTRSELGNDTEGAGRCCRLF